jgi:NAD(P)-dependent dehydrogenase (short-subunit alcohol dehydrogenase family)
MSGFSFARGKTALITGGASGIGLAVAKRCVDNGMRALIVDNNATLLSAVEKDLGDGALQFEMDVGKAEDWVRLRERVTAIFQGTLSSR